MIETITDAISIDRLRKAHPEIYSLRTYYVRTFGGAVNTKEFKQARKNFVRSMAGYSLLCYILQIKDRHNANILIDSVGHVLHVDFGFMLSNSPGSMNFEAPTFKLTSDFVEVMGGTRSHAFRQFKALMCKGFLELRNHAEQIISFVEMTMIANSHLACFSRGCEIILAELRERFKLDLNTNDCKEFMLDLIEHSTDNWRT
jgi:phosphatidylinositol kinase/protein kinase (PI-3  family)